MVVLLAYSAVAAAFYLASALELRRARGRARIPRNAADHFILHLVAVLAALLWLAALPVLLLAAWKRLRPSGSGGRARIQARLSQRRTHLAG